jgi:hypothetical protein
LRLARHSGARKSGLHRIDRKAAESVTAWDFALWAPWEGAATAAIFSLGNKTLRPKKRSVNLKPSQK